MSYETAGKEMQKTIKDLVQTESYSPKHSE